MDKKVYGNEASWVNQDLWNITKNLWNKTKNLWLNIRGGFTSVSEPNIGIDLLPRDYAVY